VDVRERSTMQYLWPLCAGQMGGWRAAYFRLARPGALEPRVLHFRSSVR
jgi:hypothetical protein